MSEKDPNKHRLSNSFVNALDLTSGIPDRDVFSDPGYKIAL